MSLLRFHLPLITACVVAFATNNSYAAESCSALTTPYTATYFGSYKGWRITTTQALEMRPKGQWRLSTHADNPLGSILEKTYFRISDSGKITSEEYSYQKKIFVNKSLISTVFDWTKKRAITSGDKTGNVSLVGGEYDNLNYQLELRCDLMAGKTSFLYPVVDRDEVDDLAFKVMGEEELETKIGKVNAVIVKRIRNNNNRITTLWFAKDRDYLMVKLLQEERKDTEAYLLYIDTFKK